MVNFTPVINPSIFINNLKTQSSRVIRKNFHQYLATFPLLEEKFWSRAYCLVVDNDKSQHFIDRYLRRNKEKESLIMQ